jgi:hypothetical protein
VVPAKGNMAVTADTRARAAAGEGLTVGHRVHTVYHGQSKTAWRERLETEVGGIAALTSYDQYGTPERGRRHNRRDFHPNLINAVVVSKCNGRDYGPRGKTVFLTNAAMQQPLQPFDDYDDRSSSKTAVSRQPNSSGTWAISRRKRGERCGRMWCLAC